MPEVKVFTRSNCTFCDQAKELLSAEGIQYSEVYQAEGTVPQIYVDGNHVGGFQELMNTYLEESNWNSLFKKELLNETQTY